MLTPAGHEPRHRDRPGTGAGARTRETVRGPVPPRRRGAPYP
ncbi:hypothetical protein STTU_4632 [Streptomyces sp. Tu6071]|nr:hypothetical protein STTU_4632 [Streptomyces sp. Tu6071]